MAGISERFGSGGANLAPGGSQGEPSLATVLRDIADDLNGGSPITVGTADAVATAVAAATDLATVIALANDLRTRWNAAVPLINELKARNNATASAYGASLGTVAEPFDTEPARTLIMAVNGGAPATATFDAAAAVLTGAIAQLFDMRGSPNLRVRINGGDEIDVPFSDANFVAPAAATAAEVVTRVDAVLGTDVVVSSSTNHLRLTTVRRGIGASLQVTGGSARAILGFSTAIVYGTGDVEDIDAVTFEEAKKVIEADVAGSEVIEVSGRLLVRSTTAGAGGSIAVTGGTAAANFGLTDTAVHAGSAAGIATKTYKI